MSVIRDVPFGIQLLSYVGEKCHIHVARRKVLWYRISVLVLTFIAYTFYHMSRKSLSVVKNVLHQQNCSNAVPSGNTPDNSSTWCDWAPFDGANASTLLGYLDSAFLFAYAIGMFISGMVAERVNLRYFLSLGMIFSGIFIYLFGIAKLYNIHTMWYFIIVQIGGGFAQTTGWPGVVTVVGNWFGEGNRGLIFGIWNSHTSVGNILGSIIAGEYVENDWGLSFIVPAIIIASGGFLVFLFLVTSPSYVNCPKAGHNETKIDNNFSYSRVERRLISESSSDELSSDGDFVDEEIKSFTPNENTPINSQFTTEEAISFWAALKIPGVVEFSLSLFFAKLVSYTFLYWLPLYIKSSTTLGATLSAFLSTLFDVGGIIGGIAAGIISDYTGMSATTCTGMLVLAFPMLLLYELYGTVSLEMSIILLIAVGILVNGPYSLISTAVSAELGTHSSLQGSSKALATVTAIIDGTGSIGAAVGPLLAGLIVQLGWENVFYMLMISDVLSLLFLCRLVVGEIQRLRRNRNMIQML